MTGRILTDEEITNCVPSNRWLLKYNDLIEICKAQDAKTAAQFSARLLEMLSPDEYIDKLSGDLKRIPTGNWILSNEQLESLKKEFGVK